MNDYKARGYKYVMKPEALINVHYKKTKKLPRNNVIDTLGTHAVHFLMTSKR